MGKLGQAVNSVTDLAGVRLFKGGTLSDQGARRNRDAQGQALKRQRDMAAQLSDLATMLLGGGTPWADVLNQRLQSYGGYSDATRQGQYDLDPVQRELANTQAGLMANQQRAAIEAARRALAQRGITSGPIYDATMQRLSTDFSRVMSNALLEHRMNARQQRMADELQYLSLLANQIGMGAGQLQSAMGAQQGVQQGYGNMAAEAQARADAGQARLMAALGGLQSGAFSASGTPWSIGGTWKAPKPPTPKPPMFPQVPPPIEVPKIKIGGWY